MTPLAIGWMIKSTGSFEVALTYVASLSLLGAFAYLVIVGTLQRLDPDDRDGGSRGERTAPLELNPRHGN